MTIKHESPEGILRLARNFMESRILLSGAELNVFTILHKTPLTGQELSQRLNADLRAMTILLDALAALGLLDKDQNTYRCPSAVASLLSDDSPHSVLPMVLHAAHLWRRWSCLTDIVGGTDESAGAKKAFRSADEMKAFIGAMHVAGAARAREIVAALNPGSAKALLDVGGASGTYTIAFLQVSPDMKATLFDQPEVIAMADERLREAGLINRVALVPGDFYRDKLPQGHDFAFVSAIIHQSSPEQNLELYKNVFRSLNTGGRIVIRDHVMEPDRINPKNGAVFAVNMLVATNGGGTYTFEEIRSGLTEAGFRNIRLLRSGENMGGLVDAVKP